MRLIELVAEVFGRLVIAALRDCGCQISEQTADEAVRELRMLVGKAVQAGRYADLGVSADVCENFAGR